jgi:hypothetical protein
MGHPDAVGRGRDGARRPPHHRPETDPGTKAGLGSHIDRHENIGEGEIGRAGFKAVLAHPALADLPAFIETPGFEREGPDRKNIALLKRLRGSTRTARRGAAPAAGRRRAGAAR